MTTPERFLDGEQVVHTSSIGTPDKWRCQRCPRHLSRNSRSIWCRSGKRNSVPRQFAKRTRARVAEAERHRAIELRSESAVVQRGERGSARRQRVRPRRSERKRPPLGCAGDDRAPSLCEVLSLHGCWLSLSGVLGIYSQGPLTLSQILSATHWLACSPAGAPFAVRCSYFPRGSPPRRRVTDK